MLKGAPFLGSVGATRVRLCLVVLVAALSDQRPRE